MWMHEECLIDDILTKTYKRLVEDGEKGETKGASKSAAKSGEPRRKIWEGEFDAKFHTVDTGSGSQSTVTITDLRDNPEGPKPWTERIACLKCESLLD
jgi:hypothetical protein